MRGNELLDKMNLVDPAYVEAADTGTVSGKRTWVRWGALAACLCLVIAGAIAVPRLQSEPAPTPNPGGTIDYTGEPEVSSTPGADPATPTDRPRDIWTLYFNEVITAVDAVRRYIPGYFTEALDDGELAALTPDGSAPDMTLSGYAGFDGEGTPIDVFLTVTAPFLDGPVDVHISRNEYAHRYELSGELVLSTVNGVDFKVYRWNPAEDRLRLEAHGEINGYFFVFGYEGGTEAPDRAAEDLSVILDCFSRCADGKPDLSAVTPQAIPEFFDRKLTLTEAKADADFGAFMLGDLPGGFVEETIRRYKDQNNDYLSGLWIKGYDSLQWKVSRYTEADAHRVTSVEDIENYDLSLYPIPHGESVPEELRQIVGNPIFMAEELTLEVIYARAYKVEDAGDTDGWRMAFSVKYGDMVVEVRTKGVEPEWVYQQLMDILEQ